MRSMFNVWRAHFSMYGGMNDFYKGVINDLGNLEHEADIHKMIRTHSAQTFPRFHNLIKDLERRSGKWNSLIGLNPEHCRIDNFMKAITQYSSFDQLTWKKRVQAVEMFTDIFSRPTEAAYWIRKSGKITNYLGRTFDHRTF